MLKRIALLVGVGSLSILGMAVTAAPGSTSNIPSGQVTVGRATLTTTATGFAYTGGGGTVEPAYDSAHGSPIYLLTPTGAKPHPNAHNVAPLYIPVYPVGSGIDSTTLNCTHRPADNCPDHGFAVAGGAAAIMPSVYGGGVLGHDHLAGIASTGGDFNVLWEPTLVLFTSASASTTHITTLAQITAALAAGQIIEVPLPQLDFNCASVSAAVYNHGTPVTPVPVPNGAP
jgi:hypothetical protein